MKENEILNYIEKYQNKDALMPKNKFTQRLSQFRLALMDQQEKLDLTKEELKIKLKDLNKALKKADQDYEFYKKCLYEDRAYLYLDQVLTIDEYLYTIKNTIERKIKLIKYRIKTGETFFHGKEDFED